MLAQSTSTKAVLLIHGGAGSKPSQGITPDMRREYEDVLRAALLAGYDALQRDGANSLDAVEAAVLVMEDSPLLNAGKGAVFTRDGRIELDAAIMEGRAHRGGAVAGVTTIKNPICAARAVMERTDHVLLIGSGADEFAANIGLELADNDYFRTERRWAELQRWLQREQDTTAGAPPQQADPDSEGQKHGTVGAVALDRHGLLAAGTSTGGRVGKQFGRVGDTPILGAGTYADNATCAVSATGDGEFFIRFAAAYDVVALMKYRGLSVQDAASQVIHTLKGVGGDGGLIALDASGNFAMPYNTPGMHHGYITAEGTPHVFPWGD